MLLKPLTLAAAGLAAATSAFLLPPEISQSDIDIVESLPEIQVVTVPEHINLNLSCPGCLQHAKGRHHSGKSASDRPSHLELAFSIDHTLFSRDTLVVNGIPLFPPAEPLLAKLKASLVADDVDGAERPPWKQLRGHRALPKPRRILGFQLLIGRPEVKAEDALEVVTIDFQVVEVGKVLVDGIPNVHINLIRDVVTGALAIGNIEKTESIISIPTPVDNQEECTTFLCQWIAMMKGRLHHKPCGGMKHGGAHSSRPHHDHDHDHHHHDHHGHHGRPHKLGHKAFHHSWGQLFKNIGAHILLPVAIGIIAGVSVSLIGMAVGTLIVSVWRAVFRRRCGHRRSRSRGHSHSHFHSHHKASKKEVAAAEAHEKAALIEHEDPPPSYEADVVPKTDV